MIDNILFLGQEKQYPRIEFIGQDKKNWNFEEVNFVGFEKIGSQYFLNNMTTLKKANTGKAKELSPYLFENDINLEEVTLSDEIEILSKNCFNGCSKIDFDKLPDNLTRIDNYCFHYCENLSSLLFLPNNLNSIGAWAFENCVSLALNSLPENLQTIEGGAFNLCASLALTSLPESIATIGEAAFRNCSSLVLTLLPPNLTIIESNTFQGCTYLQLTSLPIGIKSIGAYAFKDCTSLPLASLPSVVTSIGIGAFENCESLQIESLPQGVTSIRQSTFYGCTGLTTFTIPSGVTKIEQNAFSGCTGITTINYNAENVSDPYTDTTAFINVGKYTDGVTVIFGDLVTTIPAYLFYVENSLNSPNIKEITIGENVASIGNYAFANCVNLTNINYNAINVTDLDLYSNNKSFINIGQYSDGVNVVFGDSVTRIPEALFYGSYPNNIKEITIGENVESIGNYAFWGCKNLNKLNYNTKNTVTFPLHYSVFAFIGVNVGGVDVVFGDSVRIIPTGLFRVLNPVNKPNIKSVILGKNITSIGIQSFDRCGFSSIEIFENIEFISNEAFMGCTNLTDIIIHKSENSVLGSPWGATNPFLAITWIDPN